MVPVLTFFSSNTGYSRWEDARGCCFVVEALSLDVTGSDVYRCILVPE